ncbi:MAG: hypothetical protein AAGB26_13415 [Planctomycetota bacterium]
MTNKVTIQQRLSSDFWEAVQKLTCSIMVTRIQQRIDTIKQRIR